MAIVRVSDLLARLNTHAQTAIRKADANNSGSLSAAEIPSVTASLQAEVASARRPGYSLSVPGFNDAFARYASSVLQRADTNADGSLSDAEQRRLPTMLADNVLEVMGRPTTPVIPTDPVVIPTVPTPVRGGTFGISGTVPANKVTLKTILDRGLNRPTAMAFNPTDKTMWVVNFGDDSSVIVRDAGTSRQSAKRFQDDSAHFMNNPMAIAFARGRNEFATVQDTDNDYNAGHHGNMFMGPTLWTADTRIFQGGTQSHLDMLHHSPNAMGIAAGADGTRREYWVANGMEGSLDRYFFNTPHALGADDHTDGLTYRYGKGSLRRVPGVPSHMALNAGGTLFIADTGNGRIATFDTTRASMRGNPTAAHHGETPLVAATGPALQTFAGRSAGLKAPSGLILKGDNVVVSDYATGHILVFGSDGQVKGDVDTGLGPNTLMGLTETPSGALYVIDSKKNRIVEVTVGATA